MVPATALARVPLLWAAALGGWQRRVCVISNQHSSLQRGCLRERVATHPDENGNEARISHGSRGFDGAQARRSRHRLTSHVKYRLRLPAPWSGIKRKVRGPHCPPQFPYYVFKQRISSHRMIRRVKKRSENALDSCRGRPSLPPTHDAQRRACTSHDAGGGLDSRGVRSPTGEHETRAKDHAWRRKGRIPRVAERLLLDVGGEGKRSLPRALF